MKKIVLLGLLALVSTACTAPTNLSTGAPADAESSTATMPQSSEKRYTIDKAQEYGGLTITVGEVLVDSSRMAVGMTVKNNSQSVLAFYPDQGSAVIGDRQVDANMFMTEGSVGGELQAGVSRSGVIVFAAPNGQPLDPAQITTIKLALGQIVDMQNFQNPAVDVSIDVELK